MSGNKEAVFTCPVCGKDDKFYVNTETGEYICFRASCDTKGGWKDLIKLLGDTEDKVSIEVSEIPREIQDPEPIPSEVVDKCHQTLLGIYNSLEKYFSEKRGYTIETIKEFRLGWGGRNILIPIFDEQGNCVNFKQKSDPTRPNPAKGMFSIAGRGRMRLFNSKVLMGEEKPKEVIICEGEWDCMKLTQEGYVAVSSTGGTGSFKPEWIPYFQGVGKIYICQDNDENGAGQKGARKIAKMLSDQKLSPYMVNLPNSRRGIEEKIDITDFFTRLGKNREHFDLLLQTAQQFETSEDEKEKFRLADYLCELAIGAGVGVFLDQVEEPYLVLPEEQLVAYPVTGGKFRGWLSSLYWELEGIGFSGDTYKEVTDTLTAKAHHEGKIIQLWNRVSMVENTIYFDLGDGRRTVKIDKDGWEITTKAPVRFRRFYHQLQQVEPDREGNITEVTKFVNLKNEKDKLLYLTYLVTGLNPTIPRVLLTIYGSQGSAKSTTLRLTRCILDPSHAGTHHPSKAGNLLSPPKDETDLAGKSLHHYCLYFDNLSYCPDWMSDAFARLITGASFSKRKLYTDADEVTFNEMPLLGMNAITLVAEKPDLLDRLLILEMEQISKEERKTEKVFWEEFRTALPCILGGLFTVLSKTLGLIEELDLGILPRMADYAAFATAAAVALGSSKEEFLQAFNQNIKRQNQSAIESSPVAQVVLQFMQDKKEWNGSSTDLYTELFDLAEKNKLKIGGREGFPKSSHWLWKRIQQVKSNLSSLGIEVYHDEDSTSSIIQLMKVSKSVENDATTTDTAISSSVADGNMGGNILSKETGVAIDPKAEVAAVAAVEAFPAPLGLPKKSEELL